MSHGLLMLDLEGTELTKDEKHLLTSPEVGGIILFSRNYKDTKQLTELTQRIRTVRPDLLLAVDQEGGRVQRFKGQGFTPLPQMHTLEKLFEDKPDTALHLAHECGAITGEELASHSIDINLAPVLDINRNINLMLGNRCFSHTPDTVIKLTSAYISGLMSTGVHAVGKHFPGHGGVSGDTHISLPRDTRSLDEFQEDIAPFAAAIRQGIGGLMPSHVIYPEACTEPAGFSSYWLQTVLREQLKFEGAVFSDCLNMAAASVAGSFSERAEKALGAGCDMLLVCNNRKGALETLQWLKNYSPSSKKADRLKKLKYQGNPSINKPRQTQLMNDLHIYGLLQHPVKKETTK